MSRDRGSSGVDRPLSAFLLSISCVGACALSVDNDVSTASSYVLRLFHSLLFSSSDVFGSKSVISDNLTSSAVEELFSGEPPRGDFFVEAGRVGALLSKLVILEKTFLNILGAGVMTGAFGAVTCAAGPACVCLKDSCASVSSREMFELSFDFGSPVGENIGESAAKDNTHMKLDNKKIAFTILFLSFVF